MADKIATYGSWKVTRSEDHHTQVFKDGILCEKSAPALREIAEEIGLSIDPEWRTSQLSINVMKAMESASSGKETNNNTQDTTTSIQQTSDQPYVANGVDNSSEVQCSLNPFYNGWKSYSKTQLDDLLHKAEDGDVIAQYKYGYILYQICDAKKRLERVSTEDDKKFYTSYIIFDYEGIHKDAYKWLKAAAEQGLGLAMHDLSWFLFVGGYQVTTLQLQLFEACDWIRKCQKVNPWRNEFSLFAEVWTAAEGAINCYSNRGKMIDLEKQLAETKEKLNYWFDRYKEMEKKYNERVQVVEEKIARIEELEEQLQAKETRLEFLKERNANLRSAVSSSSSSSSSSDEMVDVKVTINTGGWFPNKKTIKMSKSEYKALLNGSMKSRISYAKSHRIELNIINPDAIKDVTVELT